MNIFVTDKCPTQSAKNLAFIHIRKMLLESYQLICNVHIKHGSKDPSLYKPSHMGNRCTLWTSASVENYNWLCDHIVELNRLYEAINNKKHASHTKLKHLLYQPPLALPNESFVYKEFVELTKDTQGKDIYERYQKYLNHKYNLWLKENNPKIINGIFWYNDEIPSFITINH